MRITGGVPVTVPYRVQGDGRFALPLADIEAAITPRTRVIVVNSPSNPTGWTMPLDEMKALRDLARARDLWILSDEVYAHFTYGNAIAPSFLQICTEDDRLIVTNTFSKNWAMTGWRAGWLIARGDWRRPSPSSASTTPPRSRPSSSTPPSRPWKRATASSARWSPAAPRAGRSWSRACRGCPASPSRCGGRLLPDGPGRRPRHPRPEETSLAIAFRLLEEAKVGVAPGTAFGPEGEGFIRLCFAISPGLAREAVARLTPVLSR